MRITYEHELEELNKCLRDMAMMVEKAIEQTFVAFEDQNYTMAEDVIKGDRNVNDMERAIESRCLSLILRQQPVAKDLRQISTALKVVTDLERIGDHAMNLAGYAKDLKEWDLSFSEVALEEIEEMKKQSLAALELVKNEEGSDLAKMIFEAGAAEQQIDDLRDKYFKKQMQRMKKGKCKPQSGIIFTEMLTDFERMGDHVKNIAQQYKQMSE